MHCVTHFGDPGIVTSTEIGVDVLPEMMCNAGRAAGLSAVGGRSPESAHPLYFGVVAELFSLVASQLLGSSTNSWEGP